MNHHPSPNEVIFSPKKRCSAEIKHRIELLQSLGCCLDLEMNPTPPTRRQQQRHSFGGTKSASWLKTPSSSSTLDTSNHRRSLRTSIQLPITPCLDIDDPDENEESTSSIQRKSRVSFADMTDVCFIPDIDDNDYDALYYNDAEIADFRHEAFLEKCGITHLNLMA